MSCINPSTWTGPTLFEIYVYLNLFQGFKIANGIEFNLFELAIPSAPIKVYRLLGLIVVVCYEWFILLIACLGVECSTLEKIFHLFPCSFYQVQENLEDTDLSLELWQDPVSQVPDASYERVGVSLVFSDKTLSKSLLC